MYTITSHLCLWRSKFGGSWVWLVIELPRWPGSFFRTKILGNITPLIPPPTLGIDHLARGKTTWRGVFYQSLSSVWEDVDIFSPFIFAAKKSQYPTNSNNICLFIFSSLGIFIYGQGGSLSGLSGLSLSGGVERCPYILKLGRNPQNP